MAKYKNIKLSACFWRQLCDRLLLLESGAFRGCARRCWRAGISTFKKRVKSKHVVKFDKNKEKELASMFKALSHPTRLWIVRQLAKDEHCVREFVDVLGVEFATVSRHLAKLKAAGILTSRKQGREIWYGLNRTAVSTLVAALG